MATQRCRPHKPQRQSMGRHRDFNLKRAVIITEDEHDDGYTMETPNDVVFVLPNNDRADPTGANLLNSAKLLMACTPNGI